MYGKCYDTETSPYIFHVNLLQNLAPKLVVLCIKEMNIEAKNFFLLLTNFGETVSN